MSDVVTNGYGESSNLLNDREYEHYSGQYDSTRSPGELLTGSLVARGIDWTKSQNEAVS